MLFLYSRNRALNFISMEMSLVPLFFLLLNRSPTKEAMNASMYLFAYTVMFRVFFLLDMRVFTVYINKYSWLMILRIRCLTFLSKLPAYRFHHWLPKAHVECLTVRSVVLARLLLKMRLPMVSFNMVFFSIRAVLTLVRLRAMLWTLDFKIWVAFSSITHMTLVFLRFHLFMVERVYYYFVLHTVISRAMFFFFSHSYYYKRSRNIYYFSSYHMMILIFYWIRLPILVNFLCELWIIKLMRINMFVLLLVFFLMFFFMLVRVKFRWSRDMIQIRDIRYHKTYWLIMFIRLLFWVIL